MSPQALTRAAARRAALAAQGFGRDRPARVTARHVARVIDAVAQFQIDSVNVAVRAHYVPLFARLGPYDRALLDRASGRSPRRLFEYWGHAASLVDVTLQPALRQRMAAHAARAGAALRQVEEKHPGLSGRVLAEVARHGPLTPREIEHDEDRVSGHWGWNWSAVKRVLEAAFDEGTLSVSSRTPSFERRYDLTERVLPPSVLEETTPDLTEAHRILVRRAARALGVASLRSLATYFYLKTADVRRAVTFLVGTGELIPVRIEGMDQDYWRWHEARIPRSIDATALVSPFDTLVFDRPRLLELFDTDYRIEIYTPSAQRRYGYYVYLFVRGDRVAARVDLKARRASGTLTAQATWLESGADAAPTARALASQLHAMAQWLDLREVEACPRGDLAAALGRHL